MEGTLAEWNEDASGSTLVHSQIGYRLKQLPKVDSALAVGDFRYEASARVDSHTRDS